MNIIKKGKVNYKGIKFKCTCCGCVFEAFGGEYETNYSQLDGYFIYICKCPTCGNSVITIKKEV